MDFEKNVLIMCACDYVMAFHYGTASASNYMTLDSSVKEQTGKIMKETSKDSPFAKLIENHEWKVLFGNERWLTFLEGAQNFSTIDSRLCEPLKVLSEFFPEETKIHIIPGLLR